MNRSDLKKLSAMRLSDAKALLRTRRNNAGAYYIAGYAVECAIKACIARQQGQYPFPAKIKESDYYIHSPARLLETAGLSQLLGADRAINPDLDENWSIVANWSETERYQPKIKRALAESLVKAIEDPQNGILVWLKKYW